jgi:glycosyltransferase involved in cell wall biosynthesis
LLLDAMAIFIHQYHMNATLTIAGDGGEIATLRKKVKGMGMTSNVVFTGWVSSRQIVDLCSSHHVFVCASTHETFCYAALEAIASGLPVIGMPTVGILSEFVSLFPEETALSELTSTQIAEKLSSFYDKKNKWQQIAKAMVQVASERFTWQEHRMSLQNLIGHLFPKA